MSANESLSAEVVAKPLDFGDYCLIEQKRYGGQNEMYLHKVIRRLHSNAWVDVPVDFGKNMRNEIIHSDVSNETKSGLVPVLLCVVCGVDETEVRKYRESDCKPTKKGAWRNE